MAGSVMPSVPWRELDRRGGLEQHLPALLLLSASGPAALTPGVPLPGDRWVGLGFDMWTQLSFELAPWLSLVPVSGGRATMPNLRVPASIGPLPSLWAAAFVIDPARGELGTITDTLRLR